ncbi:hypothetical protein Tco_1301728 [Tanacetum coccineum]
MQVHKKLNQNAVQKINIDVGDSENEKAESAQDNFYCQNVSTVQTQTVAFGSPRVSALMTWNPTQIVTNSGANLDRKSQQRLSIFLVGDIFLGNAKSKQIVATSTNIGSNMLLLQISLWYITAKVAGKPVSISEASIRSDLLFDDADGIDSLPNQAIFEI